MEVELKTRNNDGVCNQECIEKTNLLRQIKKIPLIFGTNFTRDNYRQYRKDHPSENLPSADKISQVFGSFKQFKLSKLVGDFFDIMDQTKVKDGDHQKDDGVVSEKELILKSVEGLYSSDHPMSRHIYRQIKANDIENKWPTCSRIEKVFGSFTAFKNALNGIDDDWNPSEEDLQKIRYAVAMRRKELFGRLKYYDWDPRSRKGMAFLS